MNKANNGPGPGQPANPAAAAPGGPAGAKPQDGEQRGVGPIVHMRADSDSMLESMFAVALKSPGTEMPLTKPMRMRNLPASFWKPPGMGSKSPSCHSRENSYDSTSLQDPYSPMQSVGSPQPMQQPPTPTPQNPPPGAPQQQPPPPHHSRAHSSPAVIQNSLVAVQVNVAQQQQQQQHQQRMQHPHHRQASFDVNLMCDNLGPLPPGWETTRTPDGQVYFMNHITKSTQWEDPRQQVLQQVKMEQQQQLPPQIQGLGPLPKGWEQGVTGEGEIYFIDHLNHKTQWHDPRLPLSQQVVPHRVSSAGPPSAGPLGLPPSATQAQRLSFLQQQRKAVQDKQAELRRMEQARQQQRLQQQQQNSNSDMLQAQEMLMRQSLNEPNGSNDPFLTSTHQQQQQADLHNRQESADSGLGMGSNFNLGSIPEDISGMESMDTGDLDTTLTGDSTPTAGSNAADDHLMTSLPVDLDEDISSDIINLLNSRQGGPVGPGATAPPGATVGPSSGSHDTLTWL